MTHRIEFSFTTTIVDIVNTLTLCVCIRMQILARQSSFEADLSNRVDIVGCAVNFITVVYQSIASYLKTRIAYQYMFRKSGPHESLTGFQMQSLRLGPCSESFGRISFPTSL